MRRWSLLIAATLPLSGCLNPAPPPAASPPEVVAGTSSVSLSSLPVATVAAWTGVWKSGARSLTVSRVGDQLYADGQPLSFVGLGTFADARQTSYLFGPEGQLRTVDAANVETRWTR